MFRLIGFLIGSISSIVIILLIIGMPRFHPADQEADQQRYDAAINKLRAKQYEFESVAGKLSDDVARVAETVEDGLEALTNSKSDEAADQPVSAPPVVTPVVTERNIEDVANDAIELAELQNVVPENENLWFSFWNPFRSEIAATGFVSQLESVTGLDYRVVKVKTGVYEVAFPYGDEADKQLKLSQISAATGLDLPGS